MIEMDGLTDNEKELMTNSFKTKVKKYWRRNKEILEIAAGTVIMSAIVCKAIVKRNNKKDEA